MEPHRVGRALRAIRRRRGWRQVDVAERAGISCSAYARMERGLVRGVTLESIDAVAAAFEARLDVSITWHGAALDRLVDEGHARLVGAVARLMRQWGWEVELEVSYSHYGERGSIDLLGWHDETATLLVDETKTELGGVDGLLRPLDAKVRLAPMIARERFGWRAARVGRLVVFPDDRTVRRQVARHADVFDAALPDRSRGVRGWLRRPDGPLRGLWFLTDDHPVTPARNPSAVRRVRRSLDAGERGSARIAERGRR